MSEHDRLEPRASATAASEVRFGYRLAKCLDEKAADLPADVCERLRVARVRAVEAARFESRLALSPAVAGAGRTAVLGGPPAWWFKLAAIAPLAFLVAGLLLIQRHQALLQIDTAAQIDAALLTDDLPPDAYRDPGFTAFLRRTDDR
ncbi:MAG: DUF3619 family protein [Aquabacterium sp.]